MKIQILLTIPILIFSFFCSYSQDKKDTISFLVRGDTLDFLQSTYSERNFFGTTIIKKSYVHDNFKGKSKFIRGNSNWEKGSSSKSKTIIKSKDNSYKKKSFSNKKIIKSLTLDKNSEIIKEKYITKKKGVNKPNIPYSYIVNIEMKRSTKGLIYKSKSKSKFGAKF